ncbi:MAG: DegT/DnrJ/EryC1/StrS family aminotransferase [Planctomycetes bacterium]|nr:DegT/DnrJ/EryC1/StrS family aminotransferase [Planctomycetota bacterium]
MDVPLLDLKLQYRSIQGEIHAALEEVFESQRFVLGKTVEAFEREIAAWIGSPHAVSCASGSDALLLCLMALGVGPGDGVVTTPYSFFATAGAIARLGAVPVFVDVEAETLNLDPARLAAYLEKEAARDPVTGQLRDRRSGCRLRAVLPVHLFGRCADMARIGELARAAGLPVLEDAAQAIGATWNGRKAGRMGLAGCFSFFPSKNLGGWGDGGLVTSEDAAFAERVKLLRTHGSVEKYYHKVVGINSRLDALQAAVLRVKLRHLTGWMESRAAAAARYDALFRGAGLAPSVVGLPPAPSATANHVYHQYAIRAPLRDGLRAHLKSRGVECEVYYPVPLHLQECFRGLGWRPGDLPVAEEAARTSLALPLFPELTREQQAYVVAEVRAFLGSPA